MNHAEYAHVLGDFFEDHGYTVEYESQHNYMKLGSEMSLTRFYVQKRTRPWPARVEVVAREDEVLLPAYPDRGPKVWRQMTAARAELAELLDKHLSNGFEEKGFQLVKRRGSKAPPFKAKPLKVTRSRS